MSISHISRFKTDLTVIIRTVTCWEEVFSSRKHILVMNRVFPPDLALAMLTISDDLRLRDILCLCDKQNCKFLE